MRKFLLTCLLAITGMGCMTAQTRDIHILSVNDMHATLDHMPMLAAIADSLRGVDKGTLVFSAGDNRTGDPVNDLYPIPSYPMTALMNLIGFDASTFGNHEFDSGQKGLEKVISTSNFPYLCANIEAGPWHIQSVPYQVFVIDGVKVGVLGVVQVGVRGLPDAHPDYLRGFTFTQPEEAIRKYEWLRKEVDVYILLSHVGFEDDVALAEKFPYFDLIIGGHTHTQLKGGELHNGVLITQNENKLKLATLTTLQVKDGKVVGKQAENIDVKHFPVKNEAAKSLVRFFASNPEFKRVLTTAESDFSNVEQLGSLMCDALRETTGADIALQNGGGVRLSKKKAGPFTVNDVLRLDPFDNQCVEMEVTGEEFRQMFLSCFTNDSHDPPFVSGVRCELFADTLKRVAKDVRIYTPDGKKLKKKKTYRVVCNSYVAAICDAPRNDQGHSIGKRCSDLLIQFLDGHAPLDYHDVKRVTVIHSAAKP